MLNVADWLCIVLCAGAIVFVVRTANERARL